MIKFVVGKKKKEMMIHAVLIREQCQILKFLVKKSMEEAQNEGVMCNNVNEQTFALFAEFIYTGEYTLPNGVNQATGSGVESTHRIDTITYQPKQRSMSTLDLKMKDMPKGNCAKGRDLASMDPAIPPPTSTHSLPSLADESPGDTIFLIHASLYVLAQKFGINKLKSLALDKLRASLCGTYPSAKAYYRDVIGLIKYAYNDALHLDRKDGLRMLVTSYVAKEGSKAIARSKQCLDLIEEGGPFARDLMSTIVGG